MAERSEGSPFAVPIGTLIVFMGAVAGYYLTQTPLDTSRPPAPEVLREQTASTFSARARLWQDPFAAVRESNAPHSDDRLKTAEKTVDPGDGLKELSAQIEQASAIGRVLVLPVMVSDRPYAEDVEVRLRHRYAVLSALNFSGFVPRDGERISYFHASWAGDAVTGDKTSGSTDPRLNVPYEWLDFSPDAATFSPSMRHCRTFSSILVLWLDDDRFVGDPLSRLAHLFKGIRCKTNDRVVSDLVLQVAQLFDAMRGKPEEDRFLDKLLSRFSKLSEAIRTANNLERLQFRVIGPDSSTGLLAMFNEARHASSTLPAELSGVNIYSCRATAANAFVDASANPEKQRWCWKVSNGGVLRLYRTTGNDDLLAWNLCRELRLRGVDPNSDDIALIGEGDTVYGRALPLTFAAAAEAGADHDRTIAMCDIDDVLTYWLGNTTAVPSNLHLFTYMRGVDGAMPRPPSERSDASSNEGGANPGPQKETSLLSALTQLSGTAAEPPNGPGQLDYMRRIAEEVARLNANITRTRFQPYGVKAIGVLGTDVYDKLLVLQALHERFPDLVYFTTDLDNRLLHPKQLNWTRNLIVASNYGLELRRFPDRNLEGGIPPFRDTYQTAIYHACLVAIGNPQVVNPPDSAPKDPPNPRLFEVGRVGAVDIALDGPKDLLHPPSRIGWCCGLVALLVASVLVLSVLGGMLLYSSNSLARDIGNEVSKRFQAFRRPGNEGTRSKPATPDVTHVLLALFAFWLFGAALRRAVNRGAAKWLFARQHLPQPVAVARKPARNWRVPEFLILVIAASSLAAAIVASPGSAMGRWVLRRRAGSKGQAPPARLPGAGCTPPLDLTETRAEREHHAIGKERNELNHGTEMWRLAIVCLPFLVIALGLAWLVPYGHFEWPGFEPFGVFDGISAWPAILLQLFAMFLCLFFLVRARHALHHYAIDLADQFMLWFPPPVGPRGIVRELRTRLSKGRTRLRVGRWERQERPGGVCQLWHDFLKWSDIWARLDRVTIATLLYVIGTLFAFWQLGWPNLPYRGEWSKWLGLATFYGSLVGLVMLTFFVVDAMRLSQIFARKLAAEQTQWPMAFRKRYAQRRNMDVRDVGDLLDIELLSVQTDAVGQLIFYPFIVVFVLILARMNFFDRWNWPLSLIGVYGLIILLATAAAIVLRRTAEAARESALNHLREKLTVCRGDGSESSGRAEQIQLVIEAIKNNKRGAFARFSDRPLVQAVLIPIGGLGAVGLLNVLVGPR